MTDDGGVLENLPNSRPGRRSAKRGGTGAKGTTGTAAKAATRAERSGSRAAKASPGTAPPRQATSKAAEPPQRPGDPVGDAIRAATDVAATGARIAHGVAREVLRRLPRP
jgi:hypothetical protein